MFFDLLDIILGTEQKGDFSASEPKHYKQDMKLRADIMAEAKFEYMKETDPLKREKMFNRMALGVYDFSDLK